MILLNLKLGDKMRKIILSIIAISSLFVLPVQAVDKSIGLSLAYSTVDTKVVMILIAMVLLIQQKTW